MQSRKSKATQYSNEILPSEILLETLQYTDIDTIVNICTANSLKLNLCDNQFFINKFKHDQLPILHQHRHFNKWVKEYRLAKAAQKEAIKLLKMYTMYHAEGVATIIIHFIKKEKFDKSSMIKIFDILDAENPFGREYNMEIVYDGDNGGWYCNMKTLMRMAGPYNDILNKKLNYNQVLYVITLSILMNIKITDTDEVSLLRKDLVKIIYDPEAKAYLMGYRLIDFEEQGGGQYP